MKRRAVYPLSLVCMGLSLLASQIAADSSDVWVTNPLDDGVITAPCGGTTASASTGCQSSSSSDFCCTFSNALTSLQTAPYAGGRVFFATDVAFIDPLVQTASGFINLLSGDGNTKTVDFNNLYAQDGLSIDIVYENFAYPGMCSMSEVCFANAAIGLSGGTLVLNGLVGWDDNTWITRTYNGVAPTLIFATGTYPSNYNDPIQVNDTLYLEPASGVSVALNGQISQGIGVGQVIIQGNGLIGLFSSASNYVGGTILGSPGVGGHIFIQDSSVLNGRGEFIAGPLGLGDLMFYSGSSLLATQSLFLANTFSSLPEESAYIGIATGQELVLTGDLSFLGGLFINNPTQGNTAGILVLEGNNTIQTLEVDGGTLLVHKADSLGDPATCSFSNGTLLVTDSFTFTSSIELLSEGGAFYVESDKTLSLSSVIFGSGPLVKKGAGVLVLSALNTYEGKTYVDAGTLVVLGSILASGDPIIAQGALLSGSGVVGGAQVSGGIASEPTLSLTVSGDLVFFEGSFLGATYPNLMGFIDITDSLSIEPDVDVLIAAQAGEYNQPGSFYIATFESIAGQFDQVQLSPGFFLEGEVVYQNYAALVNYTPRTVSPLAQGGNEKAVAESLDRAIYWNRSHVDYTLVPGGFASTTLPYLPEVLQSLLPFTMTQAMTQALDQLQSSFLKGASIVQEEGALLVQGALGLREQKELDKQVCSSNRERHYAVWMDGFGNALKQDTVGSQPGYRSHAAGGVVGVDRLLASYFYVGALGAYTHSHIDWEESRGSGYVNTGYAGLYCSALGQVFYGNASVIGGWSEYGASRHISYPGVDLYAKGRHPGKQLLAHLDTGVNLKYSRYTIRPFDQFDCIVQKENPYTETGAGGWSLRAQKTTNTLIRNELGIQLSACFSFIGSKWILSPKASFVREVRVQGKDFTLSFADFDSSFRVEGYFPSRSLLSIGGVLTALTLGDSLAFGFYYNGDFTQGYSSQQYGGQASFSF